MLTPEGLAEIKTYADGVGPWKAYIVGYKISPWKDSNADGTPYKGSTPDATTLEPTSLVADAHKLGLFVHPFTFRNEKKYLAADHHADPSLEDLKFFRLGVDGIFTDFTNTGVDARAAYLRELGGTIVTGTEIGSLSELPPARAVLCDVTPRQLLQMAGDRLPAGFAGRLGRFRYGPGVFKLDLAINGPIPWAATDCARAGTVHLGGTLREMAAGERTVWRGEEPDRPYVLLAQQSLFDPTRAPDGTQTVWAYCHVPSGSTADMTTRIEAQIERFAPGFRDRILARHTMNAVEMQAYNPNYIGGDISGGVSDFWQLFTRPTISPIPYATPVPGLYLCSSSTPPGAAVHGMCGYSAAQMALHGALSARRTWGLGDLLPLAAPSEPAEVPSRVP